MMMMKNPPGPYINHMLESDGVKRRALRARRLERPPIILLHYGRLTPSHQATTSGRSGRLIRLHKMYWLHIVPCSDGVCYDRHFNSW